MSAVNQAVRRLRRLHPGGRCLTERTQAHRGTMGRVEVLSNASRALAQRVRAFKTTKACNQGPASELVRCTMRKDRLRWSLHARACREQRVAFAMPRMLLL